MIPNDDLFSGEHRKALEAVLPDYIVGRRWFGGKARRVSSVQILEAMPLHHGAARAYIVPVQVNYESGDAQKYVLPLAYAEGANVQAPEGAIVAHIGSGSGQNAGVLTVYDATFAPDFTRGLLDSIREEKSFRSDGGEIAAWHTATFEQASTGSPAGLSPTIMGADQSNTSIRYGDSYILKLFRRLEEGTSPELEFGRFFMEKGFAHTPPLAGAVEYRGSGPEPLTLGTLQGFVRNQGDAWSFTLRSLMGYFQGMSGAPQPPPTMPMLELVGSTPPDEIARLAGDYLSAARLLGKRTAEMHLALGHGAGDPSFEPEPYTPEYQSAIYDGMNALTSQAFGLLRDRLDDLPDSAKGDAQALLASQAAISARFEPFRDRTLAATRIRCHGDYHLGQVLYTGDDFMIIDFEGEPARSLVERRTKHSPLKDVAGMLRSFHYAAYSGLFGHIARQASQEAQHPGLLEKWAVAWQQWVSAAFLDSYLSTAGASTILPPDRADLQVLLDAHLLEKAVYELLYELNNRPDWVRIPLTGIAQLVHGHPQEANDNGSI